MQQDHTNTERNFELKLTEQEFGLILVTMYNLRLTSQIKILYLDALIDKLEQLQKD